MEEGEERRERKGLRERGERQGMLWGISTLLPRVGPVGREGRRDVDVRKG